MKIDEIEFKLRKIKDLGFVPSLRSGSTGIGYTLETYLGKKEDNVPGPDIGEYEIKSQRSLTSSLVTLFTFDRNAWVMNARVAVDRYGTTDANGRVNMYFTVTTKMNQQRLFLKIDGKALLLCHEDDGIIMRWELQQIVDRFADKLKKLLLVNAKSRKKDGKEEFHFTEFVMYSGRMSIEQLTSLIKQNYLQVDLRLHAKGTGVRNHGTGFRIARRFVTKLFHTNIELAK